MIRKSNWYANENIHSVVLVHTQCVRDEDSADTVYMSEYNPVHIEYSQSF